MASQILSDGTFAAPINYDSAALSGLNNGEMITLNGGHVLIDSDVRWGYNAAVFGNLTVSSSLGGSVQMDGTKVWEVPFTGGTGNVPTVAEAGSNPVTGSGFSGELLRVWANGERTPRAPGTAMPSTGWIKLRYKTGNASGQLTLPGGARVTASNAGKRSWLHLVGAENTSVNIPRLGIWRTRGDWHELGTTSGNANQTFQFPVADACPAIQVETAPNSGVYEWWINAADRWGSDKKLVETDARGKFFGHNNATGVITLARRDTVEHGVLPPAGCRVRIPNLICSTSSSANWNAHTLSPTLYVRYDVNATSSGVVDIQGLTSNWFLSVAAAYSCVIRDCAILNAITVNNTPTEVLIDNCGVGNASGALLFNPLTASSCLSGVRVENSRFVRESGGVNYSGACINFSDCANVIVNNSSIEVCGQTGENFRSSTTITNLSLNRINGFRMRDVRCIGGRMAISGGVNGRINNIQLADLLCGPTLTVAGPVGAILFDNGATDILVDGLSSFAGLPNIQPYTNLIYVTGMCDKIELRNVGTPENPYNVGSENNLASFASLVSGTRIALRRIYGTEGLRSSPVYTNNVPQGLIVDNVHAGGGMWQNIMACEALCRGCGWRYNLGGGSAVYGRHWENVFNSDTIGEINLLCNEPLASTADQVEITAGTPAFTSTGRIALATVGDEVVFTMPYFALGVTGLFGGAPTIGGSYTNTIEAEFQYDKGSGWNGTWLPADAANLPRVGVVDPTIGLRLRIRLRCVTARVGASVIGMRITALTNATARWLQYPLPGALLTVKELAPGSRVKLSRADTGEFLAQAFSGVGTQVKFDIPNYEGEVYVEARCASGTPAYKPWRTRAILSTSSPETVIAMQELD